MSTFINNNIQSVFNNTGPNVGTVFYTNTTGSAVNIIAVRCTYTSNANVGSRIPSIKITDPVIGTLMYAPSANTIPASSTAIPFFWAYGSNSASANNTFVNNMPQNMYIPPNGTLSITDLANISGTDTIPFFAMWYET